MLAYKFFNKLNWYVHKPYYLYCKNRTEHKLKLIKKNRAVKFPNFNNNKIIVSIATIEARFDTVSATLVSILMQKKYFERLILNIPNKYCLEDLPEVLLSLRDYGLEINFINGPDLGPHNKYFYTAKIFGRQYKIITLDDDFYYDYNIVRKLYKANIKNANMICANRLHLMKFNGDILLPYKNWFYEYNGFRKTNPFSFFTTGGGVLFPAGCFNSKLLNITNVNKIKYADDIYLNMFFIGEYKPIYKAGYFTVRDCVFSGKQDVGLCHSNVESNNDIYIEKALELFDINKAQLYNTIIKRSSDK